MFDVISIGTATRDVFLQSDQFRAIHDPKHLARLGFFKGDAECLPYGAKIEINKPFMTVGGGGANAAVSFARAGLKTAAVFATGRDYIGGQIEAALKKERIRPFHVIDKKNGTAWSCIILSGNGERTILNYSGAASSIEPAKIPLASLRARAAYLVTRHIPLAALITVARHFRAQGAIVAANPSEFHLKLGLKKLAPFFSLLDVVIMNREEAALVTGVPRGREKEIFRTLHAHVRGIAVMTEGAAGALVSNGARMYRSGTFKEKKVADRTGAGDAFGSGFVAALCARKGTKEFAKEDIRRAIRWGSANATSVVESVGAEPGILRKKDYAAPRWKKLAVTEHSL